VTGALADGRGVADGDTAGDGRGGAGAGSGTGAGAAGLAKELEVAAADNLKRVWRPRAEDWAVDPGVERLLAFLETKTVWHPVGV
jgi:hypothetical protein